MTVTRARLTVARLASMAPAVSTRLPGEGEGSAPASYDGGCKMVDGKVIDVLRKDPANNPVPDICTIVRGYAAAYRNSASGQAKILERRPRRNGKAAR